MKAWAIVACVCALPVAARAQAPAAGTGSARLQAPHEIVLGRDAAVELSWLAASRAHVVASVGKVLPIDGVQGDRVRATYVPPPEKFPQAVILVALNEDDEVLDWLAVPLLGQGEVETTTLPGATVTVQVGTETYGPVVASKKGQAKVPILAPAGMPEAHFVITDKQGVTTHSRVDLSAPDFRRLLATCPVGGNLLRLMVLDATGHPAEQATLKVRASRGRLLQPHRVAPGVFDAELTGIDDLPLGQDIELSANLNGSAQPAQCRLQHRGGVPAHVEVVLDPQVYVAGSGTPVRAVVTITDAAKRPVLARPIVTASVGEVVDVRRIDLGVYEARWRLPDAFDDKGRALLSLRTEGVHPLRGDAELVLKPGRPHLVQVAPLPEQLRADGETTAPLVVTVRDLHGNAVDDAVVSAQAMQGHVSSFTRTGHQFVAEYTTPWSREPGEDEVIVREQRAEIEAPARVALAVVPARWQLGARLGVSTNFGRVHAPFVSGRVGIRLPSLLEALVLSVEVGFVLSSFGGVSSGERVSATTWIVPLLGRLHYGVALGRFELDFGGGIGVSIVDSEVRSTSAGLQTSRHAAFAASASVLGGYPVGPGRVVVEVGYAYTAGSGPVQGQLLGLLMSGGYRFEL